jgi:DNA invertase Pin-like site-specific DNA recombinase
MTLAYSYIRFSRPEQMRGDSLRRQLEKARAWAAERGLTLDDSLRDLGVSAYRGKHRTEGALSRFLDLVNSGKVPKGSYLIVESLDRVSREKVREIQPFFLHLINAGIVIVTLADGQEYSAERIDKDPSSLFMSLIVMTRAHEESRIKSQRISDVWSNKRAKASEKVVTARVPAWLRVVTKDGVRTIEEIPKRVEIVRRIFAESIRGRGKYTICRDLNDGPGKEPAFQVEKWQPSYVKKLLGNRAVLGEFQAYRRDEEGNRVPAGDPIPDYYPRIIDDVTFHRANAARERRTHAGGRHGETKVPLLQGIVRCATCGARMALQNRGERGGRSYTCSDRRRGLHCENDRNWPVSKVEEMVVRNLGSGDLGDFRDEPEEVASGPSHADLELLIESELKGQANLLELVMQGYETAKERYRASEARVKELRAQLAQARKSDGRRAAEPTWEERRERFRELLERLTAAGDDDRNLRAALAQEIRGIVGEVRLGRHEISYVRRKAVVFAGKSRMPAPITAFNDHPDYVSDMERYHIASEAERSGEPPVPEKWLRRPGPRT